MGVVFEVVATSLNRPVALKLLREELLARPDSRSRFRDEAEAVARLSHPNVVQIYEVGVHNGRPFLVMEFVPGGSLADRIAGGPLPVAAAVDLVRALARGVQHAHDRGVVHRDLKPANVLLSNGAPDAPKLTDFGIAKLLDRDSDRTRTGMLLGTPAYMAPEVVANGPSSVSPAADVYGLGAILYECLTGHTPAAGANTWATLRQVVETDPAPPGRFRPSVARDLDAVCLKALAKDPAERYPSARALAEDLDRLAAGRAVRARARRFRVRLGALGRTARIVAAAVAVALLVFGALDYRARWLDGVAAEQMGRDLLARGSHHEAEQVLAHGLARVEPLPGATRLRDDLNRDLRQNRRGRRAAELHELVDRLRFSYDPDTLSASDLQTLTSACGALWLTRAAFAPDPGTDLGAELERQLRADLLDLALLSADFRARNGGGTAAALTQLGEAEGFLGSDPALARLGAYYRGEPGWDRLAPNDPAVTTWELFAVGRARLLAGAPERAAELLRRAVAREQRGFWPNFYLAVCEYRQGRSAEAAAGFSACLPLARNRLGLCHYHLGLAYALGGDKTRESAVRAFDQALALEPTLAEAALNRGLLHHKAGQLPEAAADLKQALRNGYPPAVVYYHLAGVALSAGDRSAALAHAERARAADPTDGKARDLLNQLRNRNER